MFRIHLFGRFRVEYGEEPVEGLGVFKVQELLSYLLVHRNRPRPREALAALLWGDMSTEKSRKHLRQALWHIQTALKSHDATAVDQILVVEDHWVQLNTSTEIWLDVAVLEETFARLKDKPGWALSADEKAELQAAVQVYEGELLEGSYQDWCLFERERLQNIFLAMLYKLMRYCEAHNEYEAGQLFGTMILNYDRASERTHRRLMQLQYRAGDRTAALRQYERCVTALHEDLGVQPDKRTVELYEKIRSGEPEYQSLTQPASTSIMPTAYMLTNIIGRLENLELTAVDMRRNVSAILTELLDLISHYS
ncbi:MAG TPA: BTAD domain-containing putative transcriptional regulator [Pyrinomonadaceae bacterium]|nr:BTAD domain-containing putative transcriptional regulator [Pyrinomonadaceae bacterium]